MPVGFVLRASCKTLSSSLRLIVVLEELLRSKQRKRNGRREAIEPVIGHLKNNCRMARCCLKGAGLNLGLAAAAWNLKKWINELLFAFVLCFGYNLRPRELYHQSEIGSTARAASGFLRHD
jgi:hypothetical protein